MRNLLGIVCSGILGAGLVGLTGCGEPKGTKINADPTFILPKSSNFGSVAVGDFNNDGMDDIVLFTQYSNTGDNGVVYVLINNGDGSYSIQKPTSLKTEKKASKKESTPKYNI